VGAVVAGMAAVNTIDKFAENLKKWFGRAKTDEGKRRLYKKGRNLWVNDLSKPLSILPPRRVAVQR